MKIDLSTQISILSLYASTGFDLKRVVIADYVEEETGLTIYLEDVQKPVQDLEKAVTVKISVEDMDYILIKEFGGDFYWFRFLHPSHPNRKWFWNYIEAFLCAKVKSNLSSYKQAA